MSEINEAETKISMGTKYPFIDLLHINPTIKVIVEGKYEIFST